MGRSTAISGGETVNEEKYLLSAAEVAQLLNVKIGKAYAIIRELNAELKEQGKLVIRGRVNKKYLERKLEV